MTTQDRRAVLTPVPLMQLFFGPCAFKTAAVAHEIGLFARLSGTDGTTTEDLARSLGIQERPAEMLLTGCAALGLLEKSHGRYRNSDLAEEFLVPGKTYYFGGLIEMADKRLYAGWGKLGEALRTNRPTTWDPDTQRSIFEGEDPAMLETFWEAMHSLSIFTARTLGAAIDFSRFSRLLDVGGGSGAYDIELCRHNAGLRATVYELPFVCEIAAGKVAEAGLSDRIETKAGDFFADAALPAGHDVILLSMILHDWLPDRDRQILRKCFEALPGGGMVIISELLVDDEKTGPASAALESITMLVETEGRNYTPAEYGDWLRDAGFEGIETVWFDAAGANGAVVARKP
jgi:3-hydroxy-5-methyl-1-naphthoate 3-O-methyltransferase